MAIAVVQDKGGRRLETYLLTKGPHWRIGEL
jgi:hypothetical protein